MMVLASAAAVRACFLAVGLCLGAKHPGPTPRIEVVAADPADPRGGFACGTSCVSPYQDEAGEWQCTSERTAYCNGLVDRGRVVAVAGKPQVIPHEFIHIILARQHRLHRRSPRWLDDGSHEEPIWARGCETREVVPACAPLWEGK